MTSEIIKYQADDGQDIAVSEQDIRDLMAASGNQSSNVTQKEIIVYLRYCQMQRLNPFTKDVYLVKYGSHPASIIAGKETFTKRAQRNPKYKGHEAGITVLGSDGKLHRRDGSMLLGGEQLAGGWCKVYVDGYEKPIFDEVSFKEYSTGKSNWVKMPATMIRKVALCHALREAFPDDLGGLYGAEEMSKAQTVQDAPQEPVATYEEPEEVEVVEDPRKALWDTAGGLKAQAIALGTTDAGIRSWMDAHIKDDAGNPKQPSFYSAKDIETLNDYLRQNIADHEALAIPVEEPDLSENDIEF